jgi:hypothetical protein
MRLSFLRAAALSLTVLAVSCSDPEVEPIDQQPVPNEPVEEPADVTARFLDIDGSLAENNLAGKQLSIKLSSALEAAGTIEIEFTSTSGIYGTHYITNPAATNARVLLTPAVGDEVLTLTIIPIDNNVLTGEFSVTATIVATTGSIELGPVTSVQLPITDDELTNKPRGFQSFGGQWGLSRTIEYDELGRVARVNIVESTPAPRTRTETYSYEITGHLLKINKYPNHDRVFTWTGDRITKAESVEFGVTEDYTEYDYDLDGRIAGQATWHLQPNGEFKQTSVIVYLYFTSGDLYKAMTYITVGEEEELQLNTTRTFDRYLDSPNHFPMVDILPTFNAQPRLPQSYTLETQGMTFSYELDYIFDDDGFVTSRTASGSSGSELTTYQYY